MIGYLAAQGSDVDAPMERGESAADCRAIFCDGEERRAQ